MLKSIFKKLMGDGAATAAEPEIAASAPAEFALEETVHAAVAEPAAEAVAAEPENAESASAEAAPEAADSDEERPAGA